MKLNIITVSKEMLRRSVIAATLSLCVFVTQKCFATDVLATSHSVETLSNDEHYHAYLFELIFPHRTMGGRPDQYDKKYAKAFKKLLLPITMQDNKFLRRITTGPASPGEIVSLDGEKYAVHDICEETKCDEVDLIVMYRINDGRMVGRLWQNCSPVLLGNPKPYEVAALQNEQKITKDNSACK
jgi:hypothetical protein